MDVRLSFVENVLLNKGLTLCDGMESDIVAIPVLTARSYECIAVF